MTEPTPDWEFRESLLLLLSRAQRGRLTAADADLLRSHVEHLLRHLDGQTDRIRALERAAADDGSMLSGPAASDTDQ